MIIKIHQLNGTITKTLSLKTIGILIPKTYNQTRIYLAFVMRTETQIEQTSSILMNLGFYSSSLPLYMYNLKTQRKNQII